MKWRNDLQSKDWPESGKNWPTISCVEVGAIDHIETSDIFTLSIRHVIDWRGVKGFQYVVEGIGSHDSNTYLGSDSETYDKALAAGKTALQEALRRLAAQG